LKALCNLPLDPTSGSVFAIDAHAKQPDPRYDAFLQVATRSPSPRQSSGRGSAPQPTPTTLKNRIQGPATSCAKHMGYCAMSRVARFTRNSSSKLGKSAVHSPQRHISSAETQGFLVYMPRCWLTEIYCLLWPGSSCFVCFIAHIGQKFSQPVSSIKLKELIYLLFLISGVHRGVNEIFALPGF